MFFFFKQKTAYEMRSSDWSSDVCSSDLQKAGQEERGLSAEDGPAKAVDDADNRVQVVEQAPLWRDHTGTEADRRNVKSELHNDRHDIAKGAEADIQRGNPQAPAEAGQQGPQPHPG